MTYATWDETFTTTPLEGDRSFWLDPHAVHLQAVAQGAALVFLAWTYGVKLYRLEASLETAWDVQVMPDHDHMVRESPRSC